LTAIVETLARFICRWCGTDDQVSRESASGLTFIHRASRPACESPRPYTPRPARYFEEESPADLDAVRHLHVNLPFSQAVAVEVNGRLCYKGAVTDQGTLSFEDGATGKRTIVVKVAEMRDSH